MLHERISAAEGGLTFLRRAEGVHVWDADGNRYLDALSGIYTVAVGYGRPELVAVAQKALQDLSFVNPVGYAAPQTVELAEKLAAIAPGALDRAYFLSSGSEAVDVALRIARQYHWNRGDRKRHKVIARIGSYHGHTFGSLSVNFAPHSARARPPQEPMAHGSICVPNVDCGACPYEKTWPECDAFCARVIEQFIEAERPETIAALIAEPVCTSLSGFVPPKEYWQTLRRICDRHGILLVVDEVTNGIGRTGRWFGIEHFDVEPDLMAVAKGLTSGYLPLSAVLTSPKVHQAFRGDPQRMFIAAHTFGGHPAACAVALENLRIIEREGLLENCTRMGNRLEAGLKEIASRRPLVSRLTGIGLQRSLHFGGGGRPKPDPQRVTALLRARGVLARVVDRIDLAPPLVIRENEVDEIVGAIDSTLAALD